MNTHLLLKRLGWAGIALSICLLLQPRNAVAQDWLDIGSHAPDLVGLDLSGKLQQLADYRGRWVYLDFWASWCKPCVAAVPEVIELERQQSAGSQLRVLSISLDEEATKAALQLVVDNYQINYPVLYDGQGWFGALARDWQIDSIPATFLIDPQGRIVARDLPPADVPLVLQVANQPGFTPLTVHSSERLLTDSPSSGRQGVRDLQIEVAFPGTARRAARFHLYLTSTCPGPQGKATRLNVRYDILIEKNTIGAQPFLVQLQQTAGEYYFGQAETAGMLPAFSGELPQMVVSVEPDNGVFQLAVPLPGCSSDIAYALSLFDDNLGRYVNNGMRRLSTGGY